MDIPLHVWKSKVGMSGAVIESQRLKAAQVVEGVPLAAPARDVVSGVDGHKGGVVAAGVVRACACGLMIGVEVS